MPELLAEELRRLDPDEIYHDAVTRFFKDVRELKAATEATPAPAEPAEGTATKPAPRSRKKPAGS
jgi:hypothetical protein